MSGFFPPTSEPTPIPKKRGKCPAKLERTTSEVLVPQEKWLPQLELLTERVRSLELAMEALLEHHSEQEDGMESTTDEDEQN